MILDKQLLGVDKVVQPPVRETQVVQTTPSWSREYRMTMITRDTEGLRVGIQNLRDQSALLLVEGDESGSDFTLVSGNYNLGTARIRYLGTEHLFTIEDGPVAAPQESPPVTPVSVRSGSSLNEIRSRRLIRSQTPAEVTPEPEVRKFNSREELQTHLEAEQMDAIRTGKPPLPIP